MKNIFEEIIDFFVFCGDFLLVFQWKVRCSKNLEILNEKWM
jgi:hypothetical protein